MSLEGFLWRDAWECGDRVALKRLFAGREEVVAQKDDDSG